MELGAREPVIMALKSLLDSFNFFLPLTNRYQHVVAVAARYDAATNKKGNPKCLHFLPLFSPRNSLSSICCPSRGKHRPDAWNAKIIINYIHSCCCSGAPFLWYWPIGLCDAILSSQAFTETLYWKGLALHLCGLDSSNGKCSLRFPTRRMLQKTIKDTSKGFLCYKCNYGNDFILLICCGGPMLTLWTQQHH